MLVDRGIVHEHHDVLVLGFFVRSELLQQPMQEVVEHYRVSPSLRDLRRHHAVLSQCGYHGERVRCVLLGALLPLDPRHLQRVIDIARYLSPIDQPALCTVGLALCGYSNRPAC